MATDVLVTGGTGFLGRRLCDRLDAAGCRVGVLSRQESPPEALTRAVDDWHVGDVRDDEAVREAVGAHDDVVHLAGVGLTDAPADAVRSINRDGTATLLSACRDEDTGRIVFASTAGTRRRPGPTPATEADHAPPIGAYQASKAAAEDLVDGYVDDGGDALTVHPTSVVGAGDEQFTGRLLRLATGRIPVYLPGGASFVGVDDVVEGLLAALDEGDSGEHYLLGGANHEYGEALSIFADAIGGGRPPVRVPRTAVRAAGPLVGTVNAALGTRLFPINTQMADLATQKLFYNSGKARRELDYDPEPLAAQLEEVAEWWYEREQ